MTPYLGLRSHGPPEKKSHFQVLQEKTLYKNQKGPPSLWVLQHDQTFLKIKRRDHPAHFQENQRAPPSHKFLMYLKNNQYLLARYFHPYIL